MPPEAIRAQRLQRHRGLATGEQELDHRGRRELGRAAPAAVLASKLRSSVADGRVQQRRRDLRVGRRLQEPRALQPRHVLLAPPCRSRRAASLQALATPLQHLAATTAARGAAPAGSRCRRRTARRSGVRNAFSGQPPCAGHGLHGVHVDRVDVRALLAIDLDAHEVLVHDAAIVRVLEGLVLHHVAPVAGGVADRDQHGLVLGAGARERLLAPRIPVHGVVGVLEQIGRGLGGEAVRHLRYVPSYVPFSRNRDRGPRAARRGAVLARRQVRRPAVPVGPGPPRSGHRGADRRHARREGPALPGQPHDRRRGRRREARERGPRRGLRDRHQRVRAR